MFCAVNLGAHKSTYNFFLQDLSGSDYKFACKCVLPIINVPSKVTPTYLLRYSMCAAIPFIGQRLSGIVRHPWVVLAVSWN